MLTPFNRKELIITYSMKRQGEIRNVLAANGIAYSIKTRNTGCSSPLSLPRTGSAGIDEAAQYEYIIYVHKNDHERSLYLIEQTRE